MAEFTLKDYDVSPIAASKDDGDVSPITAMQDVSNKKKKVQIASESSEGSVESQIDSRARRPGLKLQKDYKKPMFDKKKYGGDSSKISHISAVQEEAFASLNGIKTKGLIEQTDTI